MDNKTKIILSGVGISAVIIPAILLVLFSSKSKQAEIPASGSRTINNETIDEVVGKTPSPSTIFASPGPATPSASPFSRGSNQFGSGNESSPSADQ